MTLTDIFDSKKKILIILGIVTFIFIVIIMVTAVLLSRGSAQEETATSPDNTSSIGDIDSFSKKEKKLNEIMENNDTNDKKESQETKSSTNTRQNTLTTPIMKVGEEELYWKDYVNRSNKVEVKEGVAQETLQKALIEKIVKESITLQEAKKQNFIQKLDETVYNSVTKDYEKRASIYVSTQTKIESQEQGISGAVVSLWFYNDGIPSEIGYEKGKEAATAIISVLQKQVKQGKLTMYEAAQKIIENPDMAKIDKIYIPNAYLPFTAKAKDEKITYDPAFDKKLHSLKEGEVTDVYIGKDKEMKGPEGSMQPTGKMIDAITMFGQVTEIEDSGYSDFEDWFEKAQKDYSITQYDEFKTLLSNDS